MTTKKITMPQLGESITEGTINSWLVKEGDHVSKYDPIADIMTDKVNAEVPTFFSGVIKEIVTGEGETIGVGEVMCYIDTESSTKQKTEDLHVKDLAENTHVIEQEKDESMKKRYSPAVLRLAQENNIDLNQVKGTGRGGRITRKDIEKILDSTRKTPETPQVPEEHLVDPITTSVDPITETGDIEIPVTGIRKKIAQNMVRSKHEIPHAWMTIEVDVTDLVQYRDEIKEKFKQQEGYNLTYFAFFVKAVAQALKEHPRVNSTWGGDKIIQRKDINLSFAVAQENELFVPVIKQADEKSIKGIAKDIYDLAIKARSGKLTTEDIEGGTFTINNVGAFGSIHSMGVINYPQAAILQVESIVKRPVIINDMFAARDMVNLSLSLDHRILDGLACGRFLARVKEILENTNRDNTNVF